MLIPATIGLIISIIFLNLSFLSQGIFLNFKKNDPVKTGKVLGVSEKNVLPDILTESNNGLNNALAKVFAEVKSLPRPKLIQLPGLEEPMRRSPKSKEEPMAGNQAVVTALNYFSAENGVVLDSNSDSLFFAKRPDRSWPIASITKLFTALTFLDYNPGWEKSYEIRISDKREGGKIYLFTGDKVTVKDLFYFSLVGSDNTATAALVQSTGLSEEKFVEKINAKIKELGLKNTRIVDPVGLKDGNISTAREIARFAEIALAREEIGRASLTKTYEFTTEQGRKKAISSTNELLKVFPDEGISILGGKTGYVNSSGYCFVSQFKNHQGQSIVTVVLGALTDSSRFSLTKKLVDLYYRNKP